MYCLFLPEYIIDPIHISSRFYCKIKLKNVSLEYDFLHRAIPETLNGTGKLDYAEATNC